MYSLWSEILATLWFISKKFPRQILKLEKSTQALSVYRKCTFHIYIKCLIATSSKVVIERRGGKKGHSLSYWFECWIEFGDASDEEPPPPPPRNRDLLKTM